MAEKSIVLDMVKVNKTFQLAQPKFEATLAAKPAKVIDPKTVNVMTASLVSLPAPIEAARLTFCTAWPKVRQMINVGLKFAAWVPGYSSQIAMAKAWLTAFNDEIVPVICGPEA